jgi:hypothetical protein
MKAVLALLIVALAVPAASAAAGDAPKKKKEAKVCKTIPKTGSNMGERLCLTVDQWVARAERAADDAEELAMRHKEAGAISGVPPGMSPH